MMCREGKGHTLRRTGSLPEKILLAAERLRGVQIENRPAVELLRKFNYPNVLIYLDPPYMPDTRHGKQYRFEMYSRESHEELLDMAKRHKGPVLISGYDSELYNEMFKDWYREEKICYSQVCGKKKEVLWMNFLPEVQMELQI